jgi:DNA-directed RNA polymerase I subunit RPA1
LREILMMASKNIKTPSMEIPFLQQSSENLQQTADKFRIMLNQATIADVLEDVNVKSYITYRPTRARCYEFKFNFLPHKSYKKQFSVKPKKVFKYTHEVYIVKLFKAIENASKGNSGEFIEEEKEKKSKKANDMGDDEAAVVEAVVRDLKNKDSGDSSDDEKLVNYRIFVSTLIFLNNIFQ